MTRPERPPDRFKGPEPAFACVHCLAAVPGEADGTSHRNHCPECLWSMHVDLCTGDRRSGCRGPMEPIAVWTTKKGEWALIHRCMKCGMIRSNRVSGDDNAVLLISIAVRPLALPPFPLHPVPAGLAAEMHKACAGGSSNE